MIHMISAQDSVELSQALRRVERLAEEVNKFEQVIEGQKKLLEETLKLQREAIADRDMILTRLSLGNGERSIGISEFNS